MNRINVKKHRITIVPVIAMLVVLMWVISGCAAKDTNASADGTPVSETAQDAQYDQDGIEDVTAAESAVDPEEVFGYEAEADDVERIPSDVADLQAPGRKIADSDKYYSPIDFKTLKAQNQDIIAWLTVPGTNISYPVCQSKTNDAYYLNHNSNCKADVNGALFTEAAYNLDDFSDPVTVVYGHNMKSGRMFGYLEETFRDGLTGHDEAIVYMPDGEIHYKIFAALRVPSGHLLAGRNMYMPKVFENFAKSITGNKDLYSVIDHSVKVNAGDELLVLSTCVGGDASQRYIVVGKKVSESGRGQEKRTA